MQKPVETFLCIKQGYIHSPFLFNFYINSLVQILSSSNSTSLSQIINLFPFFFYTDNAIPFSLNVGLLQRIQGLTPSTIIENQKLTTLKGRQSYSSGDVPNGNWKTNGIQSEQIKVSNIQDFPFHLRKNSLEKLQHVSRKAFSAIIRFTNNNFVPAAVTLFRANMLNSILQKAENAYNNTMVLETMQSFFF